jgi:hypothetical protein
MLQCWDEVSPHHNQQSTIIGWCMHIQNNNITPAASVTSRLYPLNSWYDTLMYAQENLFPSVGQHPHSHTNVLLPAGSVPLPFHMIYVSKRVKLSHYCHVGKRGEAYLLLIFDLGTRGGWVVSITPWLHFTPGKDSRYPLCRRLGGPQSWSGHRG